MFRQVFTSKCGLSAMSSSPRSSSSSGYREVNKKEVSRNDQTTKLPTLKQSLIIIIRLVTYKGQNRVYTTQADISDKHLFKLCTKNTHLRRLRRCILLHNKYNR